MQDLVEVMLKKNENGTWDVDERYYKDFVKLTEAYIKKSAFQSDRYDPDDAYSEITMQLFISMKKYGPRPLGNRFTYLLRLKTLNILTNRAVKRSAINNKLNYISESLESIMRDVENFNKHEPRSKELNGFDLCSIKDILGRPRTNDLLSSCGFLYNKGENKLILVGKEDEKVNSANCDKVVQYKPISEFSVGQSAVTKFDKIVQITSKGNEKTKILVMLTNKEIYVPNDYMVQPLEVTVVESKPVVQNKVVKVNKNNEKENKMQVDEKVGTEVGVKTIETPKSDIVVQKSSVQPKEEGTSTKKLVVSLLKAGPQTRTSLAQTIIDQGLTSNTDVKKVKSYVSVILSHLKRDGMKIVSVGPGSYILKS